jgi:hypothetical protein
VKPPRATIDQSFLLQHRTRPSPFPRIVTGHLHVWEPCPTVSICVTGVFSPTPQHPYSCRRLSVPPGLKGPAQHTCYRTVLHGCYSTCYRDTVVRATVRMLQSRTVVTHSFFMFCRPFFRFYLMLQCLGHYCYSSSIISYISLAIFEILSHTTVPQSFLL